MPSLAVHMERSTNCQHGPTCMGATHTCQTVLDACWLATNLVMQRRAWMLVISAAVWNAEARHFTG